MNDQSPCADWAEKLALKAEDLAPSERAALDTHLSRCAACQAASRDYQFLTALMHTRSVPATLPLPRFLPESFSPQRGQKNGAVPAEMVVGSMYTQAPGTIKYPGKPILTEITSRLQQQHKLNSLVAQGDRKGRPYISFTGILRSLAVAVLLLVVLGGYALLSERLHPSFGSSASPPSPAQLAVTPAYLNFGTLSTGRFARARLEVKNTGGRALNWRANVEGVLWLVLSKMAGTLAPGSHEWIIATVSGTMLAKLKGQSFAVALQFSSNGGSTSILVSASVQCIIAVPQALSFEAIAGQSNLSAQRVTITSCNGTGTWSAIVSLSKGAGWLSISQEGGTLIYGNEQSLLISVHPAGLAPGVYAGQIIFTLGFSTISVPVTLTIR